MSERVYILAHYDYADTDIHFATTNQSEAIEKVKELWFCTLLVYEGDKRLADIYYKEKTNGNQPWNQKGWHTRMGDNTSITQHLLRRLNEGENNNE
jgi:hypothetical protein